MKQHLLISLLFVELTFLLPIVLALKEVEEWKEFSVKSSIYSIKFDGETSSFNLLAELNEQYSNYQHRAKIDFELPSSGSSNESAKSGTFFMDKKEEILLLHEENEIAPKCSLTSLDYITKLLHLETPASFEDDLAEAFILGPARLLLFAMDKVSKAELTQSGKPTTVRNLDGVLYVYHHWKPEHYSRKVTFHFFYSKASVANEEKPVPVKILVKFEGESSYLSYEYSPIQIMRHEPSSNNLDFGSVIVDPFAYKLNSNCYKALASKTAHPLAPSRFAGTTRFSFSANVESAKLFTHSKNGTDSRMMQRMFVAYDALIKSMRIDISTSSDHVGDRQQVFDFSIDRFYDIMERHEINEDAITNEILDIPERDKDGQTDTSQCIGGPIMYASVFYKNYTALSFLFGSNDFVYMGKARVRGIEADVYESETNSLPFWFDQPKAFLSKRRGADLLRKPGQNIRELDNNNNIVFLKNQTILFYFSAKNAYQSLLLMEIISYNFDQFGRKINVEKEVVSIYDFAWDLTDAPDGDKSTELFSLHDSCSRDLGESKYARIELMLKEQSYSQPKPVDYLENRRVRDTAIIAGIQEHIRVPATMIFDVETKMFTQLDEKGAPRKLIAVSLRVAEHLKYMTSLNYIGQGKINLNRAKALQNCRSFLSCFSLAAHQRKVSNFGYDSISRTCYLDSNRKNIRNKELKFYTEDKNNSVEIYSIELIEEFMIWSLNTDKNVSKNVFMAQKLDLVDFRTGESGSFIVEKQMSHTNDEINPLGSTQKENKTELINLNKIEGFGLLETSADSVRVPPALIKNTGPNAKEESVLSEMTFDQCHAACISDFDCQSFSVCVKSSGTECIISKLDFKSSSAVEQLKNNSISSAKRGATVSIKLNNLKIDLLKYSNCAIYNKNYMDLFQEPKFHELSYGRRIVYPVIDREECAVKCVKKSVGAIRRYVEQELITAEQIKNLNDDSLLPKLHELHKSVSRGLCFNFNYVDKSIIDEKIEEKLNSRVLEHYKEKLSEASGYCVVNVHADQDEIDELLVSNLENMNQIEYGGSFERYSFRIELFYEKKYGTVLVESPMTKSEQETYKEISSPFKEEDKIDRSKYNSMKEFVKKGNNAIYEMMIPESDCAMYCFSHIWHMWPACRSFDMIYRKKGGYYSRVCRMSTITMQQAIANNRTDLMLEVADSWHYDPRPGYLMQASLLNGEAEIAQNYNIFSLKGKSDFKIHGFGSFLLMILGICCGIFIGLDAGRRVTSLARDRRQSTNQIIINQPLDLNDV